MMIEPDWRSVSIASVWRIEPELSAAREGAPDLPDRVPGALGNPVIAAASSSEGPGSLQVDERRQLTSRSAPRRVGPWGHPG